MYGGFLPRTCAAGRIAVFPIGYWNAEAENITDARCPLLLQAAGSISDFRRMGYNPQSKPGGAPLRFKNNCAFLTGR